MAAVPMVAGVGLMMICCSSCSSLMMGGGSEEDPGVGGGADPSAPAYTESCDDLGGGVVQRHEGDIDLDSCKQKCTDDLDCLSFLHGEAAGFCQLHDNTETTDVDVCDKGLKGYRNTTGNTPIYTGSCDDLGGGILAGGGSDMDLTACKTACSANASCEGLIHGSATGFCQLHDNNDPYGVDICAKGLKVYRK